MKKSGMILLGILIVLLLLGGSAVSAYNGLVRQNESIDGQWAQVENQMQRRYDLIPNLVNTVKGYAAHEEEVFTAIADARSRLAGASTTDDKVAAADQLEGALARLLVVVENYPQLQASEQFKALMDELTGTEGRLAVERMRFNELVKEYNARVKQFPMVLFARMLGFQERAYFQITEGAQMNPQVSFGD